MTYKKGQTVYVWDEPDENPMKATYVSEWKGSHVVVFYDERNSPEPDFLLFKEITDEPPSFKVSIDEDIIEVDSAKYDKIRKIIYS